jgi:hypothetical protein
VKLEIEINDEVGKLVVYWAEFLRQTPAQYAQRLLEVSVPQLPIRFEPGALPNELKSGKYRDPDDDPEEPTRAFERILTPTVPEPESHSEPDR